MPILCPVTLTTHQAQAPSAEVRNDILMTLEHFRSSVECYPYRVQFHGVGSSIFLVIFAINTPCYIRENAFRD
jgi:hypothetical protein